MDTVYLKLIDGARLKNHMGLKLDEGQDYTKGKNYLHIDIGARVLAEPVKRGQHVFLEAVGTVDVKGRNIILVEGNPALAEFGQIQPSYHVHPDSGAKQLGIWFTAHKNCDISELGYLVRLYMLV